MQLIGIEPANPFNTFETSRKSENDTYDDCIFNFDNCEIMDTEKDRAYFTPYIPAALSSCKTNTDVYSGQFTGNWMFVYKNDKDERIVGHVDTNIDKFRDQKQLCKEKLIEVAQDLFAKPERGRRKVHDRPIPCCLRNTTWSEHVGG